MNEMKVYRALQTHAGNINALVVKLYAGEIMAAEAVATAKAENETLSKIITEIESNETSK